MIGATGFVGLNLVDALVHRGVNVRATRRKRSITAFLRKRPVQLVSAALEDRDALVSAMAGCDVVFVAGGHYPRYSTDRAGSLARGVAQIESVCEAALESDVRRLVYVSSTGALDTAPPGRAAEEDDVPVFAPASVYRATKWAMERALDRATERGLDAVTVLPGACLGPFDVRVGTGSLLVGAALGSLPWWTDGIVNVVDVGDVANALVEAAIRGASGGRYCVAGHDGTLGVLLKRVAARYGGPLPGPPIEAREAAERADAEERAAEPTRTRAPFPRELVDLVTSGQRVSSARAARELGVRFRPVEETLDRAWAWFVRHRYLPARRGHEGAA